MQINPVATFGNCGACIGAKKIPAENIQGRYFSNDASKINDDNSKKLLYYSVGAIALIAAGVAAAKLGWFPFLRKSAVSASSGSNIPPGSNIEKPEFLYHMTTLENYESILRDGVIKKSDPMLGDGVFLSRISDLREKYPNNVLKRMIEWYAQKSPQGKIVILKLPTDEAPIKWRQINYGENSAGIQSQQWNDIKDFCSKDLETLHTEPLEFLCTNEIQADKIKEAKIVDTAKLRVANMVEDFWKQLN